jgi:hypothetical protein
MEAESVAPIAVLAQRRERERDREREREREEIDDYHSGVVALAKALTCCGEDETRVQGRSGQQVNSTARQRRQQKRPGVGAVPNGWTRRAESCREVRANHGL